MGKELKCSVLRQNSAINLTQREVKVESSPHTGDSRKRSTNRLNSKYFGSDVRNMTTPNKSELSDSMLGSYGDSSSSGSYDVRQAM